MAYLIFFGGLGMLAGSVARLLLGRMRRGARVPPPWLELAVGALWAGAGGAWALGVLPGRWVPSLLVLGWLGVAAGAVDLVHRRLPDALTLPAVASVLLSVVPLGVAAVGRAVLGAAVLVAGYLVVRLAAPAALGAGDVKLAGALGAALGAVSWPAVLVGTVLASVLTAVGAAVAVGARRLAGRHPPWGDLAGGVPHGPGMLASAWLVLAVAAVGGSDVGPMVASVVGPVPVA